MNEKDIEHDDKGTAFAGKVDAACAFDSTYLELGFQNIPCTS